jgi:mannose-6-phosphate isomerase-like protein (cupin superfamily)
MSDGKIPRFVGSHGEDWCVRPAQLGPPDNINQTQMQWLIVPGPPMSCYLAFVFPRADPTPMMFYHAHPSTWSMHVVLSGAGRHHVDDKMHEVGPGTVIYQGPGVRHSLYPLPNQPLVHLSIQHPAAGYVDKEWVIADQAGTADAFGDVQKFLERFGSLEAMQANHKSQQIATSERWKTYVQMKRREPDTK